MKKLLMTFVAAMALTASAQNPILPELHADPEVLADGGRYYIYSTTDGAPGWGGYYFTCYSSDNLRQWQYEGIILDLKKDTRWAKGNAWAPAIEKKNGKYYFYYSGDQGERKAIGVAVSDSPTGPFVDHGQPIIDKRPEGINNGQQIDVDVFTDDDGQSYLYWGNGYMAGAKLNADMTSIDTTTITVMTPRGGTLQDYKFREGAYVFKRNDIYYFLWSVDDTGSPNYHVAYGTSDKPLGPIHVADQPVILQQRPDQQIYGTAHNSVLQIPGKDEWYIVYHRINPAYIDKKDGPGFHREVCIDRMEFEPDGRIKVIEPTAGIRPDREYWCQEAWRMAQPVLENMARGELQKNMKTEFSPSFDNRNRKVVYMETFGRLMAGIAPWLALPDDDSAEGQQRRQLRQWALASYKHAVDPESPDYLCWGVSGQNLVDAAYIAESFVRAYDALWMPLDETTKRRYIDEFKKLRSIEPPYTNWLLFSSIIESFIAKATDRKEYDDYRVTSTIRKVEEWYVGDGWYADGPVFAFDYYSSYVFHAMYLETLQNMIDAKASTRLEYQKYYDRALKRAQKYSIILERFISPEGTFPVIGRSTPYRMAAMQPLAMMAWRETLPKELSNGQVRSALTAVMHRMYDQQQNYNDAGFLTIGFCGHQPETADWYTNNGSLYMTSLSLMPLGLPADHPFWTSPAEPWTQVKAWGGQAFPKDHRWADDIQTKDKY